MPRDGCQHQVDAVTTLKTAPVNWHCARCGALITRQDWAIVMNDAHEHVVFNPAGLVFRIVCFSQAPGAIGIGGFSGQFSWFKGYDWQLAACGQCRAHLGWRYAGDGPPAEFYGLIRANLVEKAG
ncbi:conserved hypothetical protein [Magnetospirillum sp. LM-5]|uniref:cereblon family protein n=1 Tax=Magnetospirillum sp. LM-5 TaxID=2681466 RepID=UPI001382782A|nr:cereblon family protein [Magnetospirillum sp. LM-5]CAA7620447.1 conserved hypothetical protein [Magnetospirillum sp. LM-5]